MKRLGFYTFLLGLLALASWLTFAELTVRRCAREGLCVDGRTLAQWQGDLESSGSVGRRADATRALARFGPRAVPALIEALKDPHPGVRSAAAAALGSMGPAAPPERYARSTGTRTPMDWAPTLAFVVFAGASLGSLGCTLGVWLLTGRAALRSDWSGGGGALWLASVALGCLLTVLVVAFVRLASVNPQGLGRLILLWLGPLAMWLGPGGIMGLVLGVAALVVAALVMTPFALVLRRLPRQDRRSAALGLWSASVIFGILSLLPLTVSLVVGPEALVFRLARLLRIIP